jgi:hypothetical protein
MPFDQSILSIEFRSSSEFFVLFPKIFLLFRFLKDHLSWSFVPFGAFSSANPLFPGLPHPICSDFRLSQPLIGFLLAKPLKLVSSSNTLGVFPFRVFPTL